MERDIKKIKLEDEPKEKAYPSYQVAENHWVTDSHPLRMRSRSKSGESRAISPDTTENLTESQPLRKRSKSNPRERDDTGYVSQNAKLEKEVN